MTSTEQAPLRRNTRQHSRQYARLWRWHFYAAFLVIPFILWQGLTGVIYLWHEDIADALWPQLRHVAVRDVRIDLARVDLDHQLAAAMGAHRGAAPAMVMIDHDATRSTQFVFADGAALKSPTFVDPYSGQVLGTVPSTVWLPGLTRALHGGWPLGRSGSWLLELGAGWCIVMVLTGLYLWWPRHARGWGGVVYPRWRAGPRVFWKDLHAVVGVWFSAIFLAFLFTALPWTDFWGKHVLRPIQQLTGQVAPSLPGGGGGHHSGHAGMWHGVALQRAVDAARREGLEGDLQIAVPPGMAPLTVTMKAGRAANERTLSIDRHRGIVLARLGWNDYPLVPKLVSTGVDLHEGTFFGRANQVFNTVVVMALLWLVVTGVIGWYRRRPGRGLSPPPVPLSNAPRWVKAGAVGLCVAMPLFGVSVALLWLIDAVRAVVLARGTRHVVG
jgi:uncharacterized iron-regulated membrane protein